MKNLVQSIGLFLLVAGLASGLAFYLQRSENNSKVHDGNPQKSPGMLLAMEKGCVACHSFDGSAGIGPTWKEIYGMPRVMTDGSRRVADEAYLRKSMLDPAAEVVTGFENIMIPPELSEAEITQLILLIRELANADPE